MDVQEVIVTLGGVGLVRLILWFFFGQRAVTAASVTAGGVQEARIVVRGGYSPDVVEVQSGRPVRLTFKREESGGCTEDVIVPDFGISRHLPEGEDVSVEFTPKGPGEHVFHCGMNMVRGKLVVRAG